MAEARPALGALALVGAASLSASPLVTAYTGSASPLGAAPPNAVALLGEASLAPASVVQVEAPSDNSMQVSFTANITMSAATPDAARTEVEQALEAAEARFERRLAEVLRQHARRQL